MINKILKSTAAVFSNSILTSVLAILLVPIILSAVGQERYGLIVLAIFLSVKNGILGIFMFGIQSAVIKFVAEYYAQDLFSRINSLLGMALLFYTIVSAVVVTALLLSKQWLMVEFFNVPPLLSENYLTVIDYVFLSIFFQFYSLLLLGYFEGLHKFFISKLIDTISYMLYFFGVLVLIFSGYGYIEIIQLWALSHVVTFLLCLVGLRFIESKPVPALTFKKTLLKTWFQYCFALFSNNIAGLLYNQAPKFLVTTSISTGALAIYDIVSKIPASIKTFVGLGNRVMVPTASELMTLKGEGANDKLFTVGLKLNLLVFTPLIWSLVLLSDDILNFWVGSTYVEHSYLMQILFLVPLLSMFMSHGFSIFLGSNYKVALFPVFGWSILIISSLYWYSEIEASGLFALVVGRVFGLFVVVPIALVFFLKYFKVNYMVFLRQMITLMLLILVPLLLQIVVGKFVEVDSAFELFFLFAMFYLAYSFPIYMFVLDKLEKIYVKRIIASAVMALLGKNKI